MTAKEELLRYRYIQKRVDDTLKEYEKYKTRAEKVNSIISDLPRGGPKHDKVADNAVKMGDLSEKYVERWVRAEVERNRLLNNIELIDEPYRALLTERYLKVKADNKLQSFEEVAEAIGYSYSDTTTKHGEALQMYTNMFLS